jgi:hypothetical protein
MEVYYKCVSLFLQQSGGEGGRGGSLPGGAYTLLYLDYTLSMFIYCTVLLSTRDIFRHICTRLGSVHNPQPLPNLVH